MGLGYLFSQGGMGGVMGAILMGLLVFGVVMLAMRYQSARAAITALTNGATGFLVIRYGISANTAFAALQKVDFWPITVGITLKQPPEANSVLKAVTKVFVTNSVVQDIALA